VRRVFADTFYWIALTDPRDAWHRHAVEVNKTQSSVQIVTTEPVLVEFLNYFAGAGPYWRRIAVAVIDRLRQATTVEVLPHAMDGAFSDGLMLYADRTDKGYSMTDCMSMQAMRQRAIYEVLTHDEHFAQEGFVLLLRGRP